jgi:hypothetical protein
LQARNADEEITTETTTQDKKKAKHRDKTTEAARNTDTETVAEIGTEGEKNKRSAQAQR